MSSYSSRHKQRHRRTMGNSTVEKYINKDDKTQNNTTKKRLRSHFIKKCLLHYMHPTLSSNEIEAQIPGKTFKRPNLYKRVPSPLIASLLSHVKNGTSKVKINDFSSRKKSKSSSSHDLTIGNFLRKIWAIIYYKIWHCF